MFVSRFEFYWCITGLTSFAYLPLKIFKRNRSLKGNLFKSVSNWAIKLKNRYENSLLKDGKDLICASKIPIVVVLRPWNWPLLKEKCRKEFYKLVFELIFHAFYDEKLKKEKEKLLFNEGYQMEEQMEKVSSTKETWLSIKE